MEYAYIKITALEALRGAKSYYKTLRGKIQNEQHPELIAAKRLVHGFQCVQQNHLVSINCTSPLIDYIRPAHLPQLNEQGHPIQK